MQYTYGDWTVSSLYTDTSTTAKNLPIPDLSYAIDYSKHIDEPDDSTIENVTSERIATPESIRYAKSDVPNIYTGTDIPASARMAYTRGVQTLAEICEVYKAVNSVSGEEVELPCKGRIVLRFPTANVVGTQLVQDLLYRVIAAAFATGSIDATREVQLARGLTLPSGL